MATASQPLPYTASPFTLAIADLILWARITFVWPPSAGIPSIILPIFPFRSGSLDELYPSPANLYSLILQLIFTTVQALFLVSIPISSVLGIGFPLLPPLLGAYVPVWLSWIATFILLNALLTILLLNGTNREFKSHIPLSENELEAHAREIWVFVNGVAAGSHWMQSNLDRLSLTFRREVYGIHNQTRGILFDLIECILERTFSYPTPATRIVYRRLLDIISDDKYDKIILILHSQGAIQGSLALDWLFATVPGEQLRRMEVYTFGSAANHFNNPVESNMTTSGQRVDVNIDTSNSDNPSVPSSFQNGRILRYIEHYANSGDYVARFGILSYRPAPSTMASFNLNPKTHYSHILSYLLDTMYKTTMRDQQTNQLLQNRYVGRLFVRSGTGHQLNGNYLDDFFPMDKSLTKVLDGNEFMNGIVNRRLLREDDVVVVSSGKGRGGNVMTAKVISRLWMYRNGSSPEDFPTSVMDRYH